MSMCGPGGETFEYEGAAKRLAEIKELERAYGRGFLEQSLHEVGIRWRALTAPNAAERFDDENR